MHENKLCNEDFKTCQQIVITNYINDRYVTHNELFKQIYLINKINLPTLYPYTQKLFEGRLNLQEYYNETFFYNVYI